MLQKKMKRSFWIFTCFLIVLTAVLLLLVFFFSSQKIYAEYQWSALLSCANTVIAAFFVVSGKEGTFKQLIGSIFFRLTALVIILIVLATNENNDPLRLLLSFLVFFLIHQFFLMGWMKREINRTKSDLFPDHEKQKDI